MATRATLIAGLVMGTGLLLCCAPRMHSPRMQPGAPRSGSGEEIRISRGPCFGFCPVYTIAVTPAGRVDFEGKRHTAVLGPRSHTVGRSAYARVRRALGPYRPATGLETELPCPAAATDMAMITIEWISASGVRTALRYRLGCTSAQAKELETLMETQLQHLGVDGWARQQTWPGDTRG